MKKHVCSFSLFFLIAVGIFAQKQFTVVSPDGKLKLSLSVGEKISYSLSHEADVLITPSTLSLTLSTGEIWGDNAKIANTKTQRKTGTIPSPFSKASTVTDDYNELTVNFKGNWGLKFRVYDDGMAYRFVNTQKQPFTVQSEEAAFHFPADFQTFTPYVRDFSETDANFEKQFHNSFENTYTHAPLSELDTKRLIFLPMLVEAQNGKKVCLSEADLESYPGMYLKRNDSNTMKLDGVFAPYPATSEQGGHNMLQRRVTKREDHIAKVSGACEFPWRVAIVSTEDKQLAVNDMTYRLASPSRVNDLSWIKPGKVAWEWWNDWNLYGVDFKTGVNNDTYKYYIDFASKNGIEYVILDEGWAVNKQADLLQVVPGIDLQELVDYGKERNVGIILWAGYWAFDRDLENVCKHYSEMGVKGFKVDFMDRDDQEMVDFIYRASETAAKYRLLLDFHGMYKPAGLQRTYPHVLNFEGVHGLEQLKWLPPSITSVDMVTYDVTVPFIRMISGQMDYTQGAMRNALKGNFRMINSEPMSQGTRCRQLALYVVFESPLNMLCDSPSNYMNEPESLDFIAKIPTVWDESVPVNGGVSEYVTVARRSGNDWYLGGITGWNGRDMEIDLSSFLPEGNYRMTLFKDGANADRAGRDYVKEARNVISSGKLQVHLSPGGGFAVKFEKL
ncbi:MAG: glycoside hydrolase family 97 protein [Proteiniphilum sp.]|jgi:alpha-glucosidase|uniref:glycoside hydrolase family 97 protein n=1 Tax=Proteiniphilum sp. TaxID=1926877 RepID=UPI002B219C93|nr:glycoside hydrolase family 97 protein [Proteiniphilum sp.]MEA5128844.1 glycoside hydrolase family 97 protein [Proteiniphilum sp.]